MKVRKAQFKIKNTNKQPSKIIIEVPGPPEVNLQNVQDFAKVCRICATITDLVLPIYEGEGLENNVAEKIRKYLPIQVNKTDVLPLVVCYQCTSTLLAWHELVKCCVQADEALQAKVAVETDQETQSTSSEEEDEQDQILDRREVKIEEVLKVEAASGRVREVDLEPSKIITVGEDGRKRVECGICGRSVAAGGWKRHSRAHSSARRHSCHTCGLSFTDSGNLARHTKAVHAKLRPHTCEICAKTFTRNGHLADHMKSHSESREYVCHICGKQSKSSAALRMHKKMHEALKFECVQCAARFRRRAELRAHASVHSGERAHACVCGRSFRLRAQLTMHAKLHQRDDTSEPPAVPAPAPPSAPAPAPPSAPAPVPPAAPAPAPPAAPVLAAPAPPAYPRRSPALAPAPPADEDEITCQYCHTAHPAERFEVHLIREHYESLFHCAECNKYIDKKLFLIHMTMHARQYMQDRESGYDSGFADNSDSGTDVSESPEVPADDEEGVALYLPLLPFREPLRAVPNPVRAVPNPVRAVPDPVPAEPARMPSVSNPVPAVPKPVKPTARIDEDDDDDDFSDQSDIEFEPLPQSVFEAIEDTEDHQPSGEANTSDEYDDAPSPEQVSTNNNPRKVSKRKKNKSSQCPEIVQKRQRSRKRRICPICSKEYTASSSYFYHMKYSHKAAKEFSCEICSAKLGTQASLKQHVASVHATEHQYECKECHKKFRSKASLYIHEQTHQEKKGWSCSQCHLTFRWKTEMQRHLKRHAAEKSYVCETCGRGFNVRYDLLRHARTHTVGKFACDKCGQTFAQLRYLKVHTSNKHSGNITAKIMHGKK